MPTDGLARYDKLSGKELVIELESVDRSRFPQNYETLLREIACRDPVTTPQLAEHEVERYEALPYQERRRFLVACLKRIGILLLQYQVLGGFVAAVAGSIAGEIARRYWGTSSVRVSVNTTRLILLLLSVASYWAFLRWMLQERVSDMEVAILRRKNVDPSERQAASSAASPDDSLQPAVEP